MRKIILLLVLCGLNAGCSSLLPQLKAPDLKVTALNYLSGDSRHQQLRLRIHVTNPNNRQIAVSAIDYELTLAGAHFANGNSAAPFTVPPLGETDFDLNVNADIGSLVKVVGAHLGEPSLDYQVSGTLHLAEGLIREIPFKSHGLLPMR
jgi:LEA14-like dessication related protein